MTERVQAAALIAALLLAPGCGDGLDRPLLAVDVVTDLRPGEEFALVHTSLHRDGSLLAERRLRVTSSQRFADGLRSAEFLGLDPGPLLLRVALLAPDGSERLGRSISLRLRRTRTVRVVLARSCLERACPGPGDATTATECLGGRCVPPSCGPGDAASCGPAQCGADAECAEEGESCLGRCEEGTCLRLPRGGACGEDEQCGADGRCAPIDDPNDDGGADGDAGNGGPDGGIGEAGVDAGRDGGAQDGGVDARPDAPECRMDSECDDGLFCNGTERCASGTCTSSSPPCTGPTPICDEETDRCGACSSDADCSRSAPYCVSGQCVECRSDGHCDDANACTAGVCSGGTCMHVSLPTGSPCASGVCDGMGLCVACIDDHRAGIDTGCGPPAPHCVAGTCVECGGDWDCNDANACTNDRCVDGTCSFDPVPDGRSCPSDGTFCNGHEACQGGTCRSPGNPCSGATPACVEETESCVECTSDTHCSGITRLCDSATNTCVECRTDVDCGDIGYECCYLGRCRPCR